MAQNAPQQRIVQDSLGAIPAVQPQAQQVNTFVRPQAPAQGPAPYQDNRLLQLAESLRSVSPLLNDAIVANKNSEIAKGEAEAQLKAAELDRKGLAEAVRSGNILAGMNRYMQKGAEQQTLKILGSRFYDDLSLEYTNQGLKNQPDISEFIGSKTKEYLQLVTDAGYNAADVSQFLAPQIQAGVQNLSTHHAVTQATLVEKRIEDGTAQVVADAGRYNYRTEDQWRSRYAVDNDPKKGTVEEYINKQKLIGFKTWASVIQANNKQFEDNGYDQQKLIKASVDALVDKAQQFGDVSILSVANDVKTRDGHALADTAYGVDKLTKADQAIRREAEAKAVRSASIANGQASKDKAATISQMSQDFLEGKLKPITAYFQTAPGNPEAIKTAFDALQTAPDKVYNTTANDTTKIDLSLRASQHQLSPQELVVARRQNKITGDEAIQLWKDNSKAASYVWVNNPGLRRDRENVQKTFNTGYGKDVDNLPVIGPGLENIKLQFQADATRQMQAWESKNPNATEGDAYEANQKAIEFAKKRAEIGIQGLKDSLAAKKDAPPDRADNGLSTLTVSGGGNLNQLKYAKPIRQAANKYGIPETIASKLFMTENAKFDPNAVSSAGAIGLGQLMPATAKMLGVNPYDPMQNIDGAMRYLSSLVKSYAGNYTLALAAYNAGPGNVAKAGGKVPPIAETQHYVKSFGASINQNKRLSPAEKADLNRSLGFLNTAGIDFLPR